MIIMLTWASIGRINIDELKSIVCSERSLPKSEYPPTYPSPTFAGSAKVPHRVQAREVPAPRYDPYPAVLHCIWHAACKFDEPTQYKINILTHPMTLSKVL